MAGEGNAVVSDFHPDSLDFREGLLRALHGQLEPALPSHAETPRQAMHHEGILGSVRLGVRAFGAFPANHGKLRHEPKNSDALAAVKRWGRANSSVVKNWKVHSMGQGATFSTNACWPSSSRAEGKPSGDSFVNWTMRKSFSPLASKTS